MKDYPAISFFVQTKSLGQIDRLAMWLDQKKRETEWSFPQIAEKSGGLVTQGTVHNILNRTYKSVNESSVRGLAKAFQITEQALWDIVNGVTDTHTPSYESRPLPLPAALWRMLDADSARCRRPNWKDHLEALLLAYFGSDVNIDAERLIELRKGDALIIQLDEDNEGELPFTSETPEVRQAKKQSKTKK